MAAKPDQLTVIFDGDCMLCRRSVHWLERQRTHVPLTTIAAGQPQAVATWGDIPGYGANMVVVAGDGRSWVGSPDAYLVTMWAVKGTRLLSYLLSLPGLRMLTGRVFQFVANNRHTLGSRLSAPTCQHCAVG